MATGGRVVVLVQKRDRERQRNMKCYNCTERGHSAENCSNKQVAIPNNWSKEE